MEHMPIDKIMTGNNSRMHFIRSSENIKSAAERMLKLEVSALPVIGDNTEIIGVLTIRDILNAFISYEQIPSISEVMSEDYITVKKGDSIKFAANLMNKVGTCHLLVEDEGVACGIISSSDFIKLGAMPVVIASL